MSSKVATTTREPQDSTNTARTLSILKRELEESEPLCAGGNVVCDQNGNAVVNGAIVVGVTCADAGYVTCAEGLAVGHDGATLVVDGADRTCEAECDGACCVGTNNDGTNNVCSGFTGRVCKDNVSCDGPNSCTGATMSYVVKSCYVGLNTCNGAGRGGSNGKIVNSCVGQRACEVMGENIPPWDTTPTVGDVIDSCHGTNSCAKLNRGSGSVGNVLNSCNGNNACYYLGSSSGGIGDIVGSCNEYEACRESFTGTPVAADFKDCCNGSRMCKSLLAADGVPDECNPVSEVCWCVMYSY